MTKDIVEILKQVGAILGPSHFVGTSGRHMELYLNKDALYLHTIETSTVGEMFAAKFKDRGVEVVVGPALGGIILSQWAAYHLSRETGRDVLAVYTEKDAEKNQIFTRGYDKVVKGKKVLVVEVTPPIDRYTPLRPYERSKIHTRVPIMILSYYTFY